MVCGGGGGGGGGGGSGGGGGGCTMEVTLLSSLHSALQ